MMSGKLVSYGLLPNPKSMKAAIAQHFVSISENDMDDGDIGFFSVAGAGHPMHLAVMATLNGRRTMIHADSHTKKRVVVEVGYAAQWPAWLDSWWRYPGATA